MLKTWWNDDSIPIIFTEGRWFCLAGWNGEAWYDCWETSDGFDVQSEDISIKPIYDGEQITGYEVI